MSEKVRRETSDAMPTRFSASGRPFSPATSAGSGSGSVLALRIFLATVSASSVKLSRDRSEGSDFDIFLVPSRRLITRVAGPVIIGSGGGKKVSPWPAGQGQLPMPTAATSR